MSEQSLPKPEQTNPALEVQFATPEDAAGIFDVQRQTWIDTYPNAEAGITEQDIRNRVEGEHGELVADKIAWWRKGIETSGENRAIFVVRDEDKVVGFVAPGIMDDQRRIGAIYVLPEAQGKGLGRKLLDKAIDWHGRDEDIYLHVASYNDNAIGFYEKNGFEKTGRDIEDLDARQRGVVEIPEIEMVLKASHTTNESKINPEEVEVGLVRPEEMQELADLAARSFSDAFGDEMDPEDLAQSLEENRSLAYFERTKDSSTIIVARYQGKLAGYAQYGSVKLAGIDAAPEDREIGRVYVDTALHGGGIGRQLMDATLADPDVASAPNVYLQVWEENKPAIALYKKYGFENSGAVEEFLLAGKPARDLIMVRHQHESKEK